MIARQSEKGSSRLSKATEKRLITRARKGEEEASRELIEAHKDRLFAFVWRIIRRQDEAEEICQETFLRAFSSLDSFSSKYRFSTWLFTIGYRLCLNHIRRKKSLTGEMDFTAMQSDEPDASARVAESEEARLLKSKIWEAVDRLSSPQKAAVMLFYREGMSCEEIAQSLDMPMATVKSHLHRARGRLRDSLGGLVKDWSQLPSLRDAAS
jgi:RNA polymerase sigma-70 factor (ECF subfamily)